MRVYPESAIAMLPPSYIVRHGPVVPTTSLASTLPLFFLRPVGFDPAGALALLRAASAQEHTVRWRLPPPGQEPDAYIAPEGALGLPALEYRDSGSDTQPDASMLQLDENGWYHGRPVCVVRRADAWDAPAPAEALDDLAHGLRLLAMQLGRTQALYQLAAQTWAALPDLPPAVLEWRTQGRLLAAVDTACWQVWLYPGLEPEQLAAAALSQNPQPPDADCFGFEQLPLEWLLWSFAQRCEEALLTKLLPERFLHLSIVHRRPTVLSSKQLGRHGKGVLKLTEIHAKTASELRHTLGLSEAALLRVLSALALTRAIQVEHPGRVRHRLHKLLPRWLRLGGR
jgi:hypothetical protein